MPRKKKDKSKQADKAPPSSPSKQKKGTGQHYPGMYIPFLKNVITVVVLFLLTAYLIDNVRGYVWLKDKFLKSNLEKIKKFEDLTMDQKFEAYFRFDARFLFYIRDNTPDSALILMPPDSVILPADGSTDFNAKNKNQSVHSKQWASYFIYPRTFIYHRELEDYPKAAESYTHVACINGWGYDKLDYPLPQSQRSKYQVLPRTQAQLKAQQEEQKDPS